MKLFESLFDLSYLVLVIALGIRLLLEAKKEAKLFGVMAVLLGLGDAFHLIPRVLSHLSPGGFEAHAAALSWGKFVTGITMTIFYVLYYHFYKVQSGDSDKKKALAVYGLALARIVLILLPRNGWGQMPENYAFGIYRNIPFAILGALLIVWSYRARKKPGLKHMDLLIFLSFLFYLPVVLFSDSYPVIGALMMPKTVAYFLIVTLGFRFFTGPFAAKNVLASSFAFLIMGLLGGVFYREFTKFYAYEAPGHLGKLHAHSLVLGFVGLLVLYLLLRSYAPNLLQGFRRPLRIYTAGLTLTLVSMLLIGINEVVSTGQSLVKQAALDGISGLGHITLSVGLVWTLLKFYRLEAKAQADTRS
ncbi:MAG: DUF2871 family protein [Bacillota bacterium]|nr:DUF2871 family protein [Bacillota bacterium]